MKKLISILVVFALAATVVFAQEGSWSIGGSGEIGTLWNFVPEEALAGESAYNRYDYYGDVAGTLSLTYSRGDLSAGISFNQRGKISVSLNYNGGDFAFSAGSNLVGLIQGDGFTEDDLGALWGYYKLLDGAIHIEAAVRSRANAFWASNTAHNNAFDSKMNAVSGLGGVFADVDGHNFLLVDFNLSSLVDGLSLGALVPDLFISKGSHHEKWHSGTVMAPWDTPPVYPDGYTQGGGMDGYAYGKLGDAFSQSIFGAKYASGPIDAAVQFALTGINTVDPEKLDSGLYFGLNFKINDHISAGVSLKGLFDGNESDNNQFAAGVSFSYGAGAFNASLDAGLQFANSDDKGSLGIRPKISYNLVPEYLAISLDTLLFFALDSDIADNWGLGYEITPELWFNVTGTGAGASYWAYGTGIILRYKLAGFTKDGAGNDHAPLYNAVDITFKWSF
jgi:hypothetical protein